MPRSISRSPSSYRRRYSPSPVSRRRRRDRSRSPYTSTHSRRRSHSGTPRHRRSRSPISRHKKSRSPTPRHHRRRRSRTSSLSPVESPSPSITSTERKTALAKSRKEEEEKKRLEQEMELKILEEETTRRIEEAIRTKVEEKLGSDEVKLEIERRVEEGRKKLFDDVEAQLEREKEAALTEARQKELIFVPDPDAPPRRGRGRPPKSKEPLLPAEATPSVSGRKRGRPPKQRRGRGRTPKLKTSVKVFTQPDYLHNFVQSTFNALSAEKVRTSTLVVSGDRRYFSKDAIQIIIKMAAANGVRRVWVGQNGLLSTPAVSAVVRERVGADGSKANGAFILTASHNPGGPNEDFGIKYNMENGGPATEGITDKIYENTKTIKEYLIVEGLPQVDISAIGISYFSGPEGQFVVEVFDAASYYVKLMNYEAHSGVAGAYAKRIFVEELGAKESSLLNCVPKEDFGGGHPDPNLTHAKELVSRMGLGKNPNSDPLEFGAAVSSDADRNMILGKRFFVSPSDSVAIIAANAVQAIPYFSSGLKGVARSLPTSAALDVVAKHLNLKFFEVPIGWKFFGNLMDAGLCSVWGEEGFGNGSDHIREKDGIWAVLAWLSILAYKNKDNLNGGKLVTVEDIVKQHWATFGRHYYTRYDYENVDAGAAKDLMAYLVKMQSSLGEVNKIIKGVRSDVLNVSSADEFEYKDPVDGSISKHQGIRYLFEDGSRLVFRLPGTGSEGATIRLYIEQYEKDSFKTGRDYQEALAPLVEVALKLSKMQQFTGHSAPTHCMSYKSS